MVVKAELLSTASLGVGVNLASQIHSDAEEVVKLLQHQALEIDRRMDLQLSSKEANSTAMTYGLNSSTSVKRSFQMQRFVLSRRKGQG